MVSQQSRSVRGSGHLEVRVSSSSGSITVIAESRDDVVAEGADGVDAAPDGSVEVVTRRGSASITVRCPLGTDIVVGTRSGSLQLRGHMGAVRATTLSGRMEADDLDWADLRTMTGSIHVGSCVGLCRVKTKTGSVRIGETGEAEVTINAGSVAVDRVSGSVHVRAISGSVNVGSDGNGPIDVETMSGSITITLPTGCRPDVKARSRSSRPRIELPSGRDCDVVVRTLSGGIVVRAT